MFGRLTLRSIGKSPDQIAVSSLGYEITYQQLERDITCVAAALHALLELSPKVVAISYADKYVHLVFILALARIGVPSASLLDLEGVRFHKELDLIRPDLIITDRDIRSVTTRQLLLDTPWFEQARRWSGTAPPPAVVHPDQVVRVAVTDGTSDLLKRLDLTSSYIEISAYHIYFEGVFGRGFEIDDLRVIPVLSFSTATGFLTVISCLLAKIHVHILDASQLGIAFSQRKTTAALISPRHAEAIISQLPPGMQPMQNLYLTIVGGKTPSALRKLIRDKLTPNVEIVYGADECGAIASISRDDLPDSAVGKVLPWVGLELVDGHGRVVGAQSLGEVRVCGTGIVRERSNSSGNANDQFRDGWFYTGDLGYLDAENILHITGRIDDLISLGGDNFNFAEIDRHILDCEGVKECAMFTVPDTLGMSMPHVALVAEDNFSLDHLSFWIRKVFPTLPPVTVIWVDNIPHLQNGRPDRLLLSQLLQVA